MKLVFYFTIINLILSQEIGFNSGYNLNLKNSDNDRFIGFITEKEEFNTANIIFGFSYSNTIFGKLLYFEIFYLRNERVSGYANILTSTTQLFIPARQKQYLLPIDISLESEVIDFIFLQYGISINYFMHKDIVELSKYNIHRGSKKLDDIKSTIHGLGFGLNSSFLYRNKLNNQFNYSLKFKLRFLHHFLFFDTGHDLNNYTHTNAQLAFTLGISYKL